MTKLSQKLLLPLKQHKNDYLTAFTKVQCIGIPDPVSRLQPTESQIHLHFISSFWNDNFRRFLGTQSLAQLSQTCVCGLQWICLDNIPQITKPRWALFVHFNALFLQSTRAKPQIVMINVLGQQILNTSHRIWIAKMRITIR